MTAVHVDASYLIHCFLSKSVILSLGNHSNSVQLTSCIFCFISLVSISSNFVQVCCDFLVLSVLGFIKHITEELIMIILVISLWFFNTMEICSRPKIICLFYCSELRRSIPKHLMTYAFTLRCPTF